MYNDSIEGLLPRKKIRIRQYPNDDDKKFYLEIKNSSVEGRFKTRKIIKVVSMTDLIYESLMAWPVDNEVSIAKTALIV